MTNDDKRSLAPLLLQIVFDGLIADPLFLVNIIVEPESQKFVAGLLKGLRDDTQSAKDRLPANVAAQSKAFDDQIAALDTLATQLEVGAAAAETEAK